MFTQSRTHTDVTKGDKVEYTASLPVHVACFALQWPVQMRAAPSVTFYPGRTDVTNTADRITQYNGATLTTFSTSPTPYSNGLSYHFAGTSLDAPFYTYHIVADAEL